MGDRIDQFHVEANGTFSEEFRLGNSKMDQEIAEATRIEKEEEVVDDDDTLKDMILSSEVPYLTIDRRTGGYIARVFNSNQTKAGQRMKHDMLGVTYKVSEEEGGHLR